MFQFSGFHKNPISSRFNVPDFRKKCQTAQAQIDEFSIMRNFFKQKTRQISKIIMLKFFGFHKIQTSSRFIVPDFGKKCQTAKVQIEKNVEKKKKISNRNKKKSIIAKKEKKKRNKIESFNLYARANIYQTTILRKWTT